MKARVNRRSVLVAGVVATIGALVIGALVVYTGWTLQILWGLK